ncbi:endonuclease/exonuclease/phosphatase family protein [Nocardioides halotolerans]|jgi:endonuclease/exonuclease/phosphatase family metal-dependent hydrolase|uniref:endonuclease/exonuclease/phosphatase family protein n=1 Tax=Nocardioides halotolerans TaxID=433660 RepID=UPI000419A5D0|nr:endonuclease/exonuclease/phosphatase family protein [Nocardioides halotolerans]
MTGFPTVVRQRVLGQGLRRWSIAALVLGTIAGGTALAVSASAKKADEYGQVGASPVPVTEVVHGKTKFRVGSFNILGYDHTAPGGSKKGYADGAQRMKWAVQVLKSEDVDVVGLQEFQPQQYAKWVKKASSRYDIFPGYVDTVGFLRNSIAWRKDKFKMVSNSWIKLPYFHGDVLRMPVVLLQSLSTGQQFYVMNFQNPADVRGNAQKWRLIGQRLQIALVNHLKASNNLPVIWTGDMNAKRQVFCRVTAQAGMISASGGVRTATSCSPPRGMVVDWIFGSGVKFKKYQQLRTRKIARTTDHHLLTTKVRILPVAATVPPPSACVTVSATATATVTAPTSTATATSTTTPTAPTTLPPVPPTAPGIPNWPPTCTVTATTTTTTTLTPSP